MDARILKTFVLGLLIVCLLTLIGVFRVWQNYRVIQIGGDLARVSKELRDLQSEHEMLNGQYHALRSDRKVMERASALGMRAPASTEIVTVEARDVPAVKEVHQ